MEQIKVLLIDPDEANRNFLTRMLRNKDYEVVHATTGQEGIEKAGLDSPSLIIFDPSLPDLSLREFFRELFQNKRTANIPCVAYLFAGWLRRVLCEIRYGDGDDGRFDPQIRS